VLIRFSGTGSTSCGYRYFEAVLSRPLKEPCPVDLCLRPSCVSCAHRHLVSSILTRVRERRCPRAPLCVHKDTVPHMLVSCPPVQEFWKWFLEEWNRAFYASVPTTPLRSYILTLFAETSPTNIRGTSPRSSPLPKPPLSLFSTLILHGIYATCVVWKSPAGATTILADTDKIADDGGRIRISVYYI